MLMLTEDLSVASELLAEQRHLKGLWTPQNRSAAPEISVTLVTIFSLNSHEACQCLQVSKQDCLSLASELSKQHQLCSHELNTSLELTELFYLTEYVRQHHINFAVTSQIIPWPQEQSVISRGGCLRSLFRKSLSPHLFVNSVRFMGISEDFL